MSNVMSVQHLKQFFLLLQYKKINVIKPNNVIFYK